MTTVVQAESKPSSLEFAEAPPTEAVIILPQKLIDMVAQQKTQL